MISMLRGEIVQNAGGDITMMVSGVGYLVHVPAGIEQSLTCGEEVTLFTDSSTKGKRRFSPCS